MERSRPKLQKLSYVYSDEERKATLVGAGQRLRKVPRWFSYERALRMLDWIGISNTESTRANIDGQWSKNANTGSSYPTRILPFGDAGETGHFWCSHKNIERRISEWWTDKWRISMSRNIQDNVEKSPKVAMQTNFVCNIKFFAVKNFNWFDVLATQQRNVLHHIFPGTLWILANQNTNY